MGLRAARAVAKAAAPRVTDARRRGCEQLVRGLSLPVPFDAVALCEQVGVARGRPVCIVEVDSGGGDLPCGMWVATAAEDMLYVMATPSARHREQIILHELAHMLCGHVDGQSVHSAVARLAPDLDPALIRSVLGRVSYGTEQEQEAELVADMIMTDARVRRRRFRGRLGPREAVIVSGIEDAFG